ncbi:MAG: trigger factor [Candidatus Eisenbacteria bacterium]|nr:trigger factor [Candidatus Eisenbacteria bacterium]
MLVRVEEAGGWKRKLRVGVPEAAVEKKFEELLEELTGRVEMPGFRKGKVPRDLLVQRYGQALRADAIEALMAGAYIEAVKEAGLRPICDPAVQDLEAIPTDGKYHFTATVEVRPEIELRDYEGLEFTEHVPIVTNVDVERAIESLREQQAELASVARPSVPGDYVIIDYERLGDGGTPVPDSKSVDYPCEVGKGYIPPELDEALAGVSAGDEKTVTLTFPADHRVADVAGKSVPFAVKVKEIREKRLPPVDDAFARAVAGGETVLDLRVRVRNSLEAQARAFARGRLEEEIIGAIIARNPFELPECLVEERLAEMHRRACEGRGDEEKPKEDEFRQTYRPVVEHQLKASLLLGTIAEKHGIKVEPGDVEKRVGALAARQGKDPAQLMSDLKDTEALSKIEDELWLEKVHDHIVAISKVTTELVDLAKLREAAAQGAAEASAPPDARD